MVLWGWAGQLEFKAQGWAEHAPPPRGGHEYLQIERRLGVGVLSFSKWALRLPVEEEAGEDSKGR